MNERIKQLGGQAGIAVWGDAVYMYDPKGTLDSAVLEKFADLIVYECMDIALGSSTKEDDMGAIIANKIKEHFGIK